MKYLKINILLFIFVMFCLISLRAFKNKISLQNRNVIDTVKVDTFQLLVNRFMKASASLDSAQKKSGMKTILNDPLREGLLRELRNYTSRIHGSREVVFRNVKYHLFVANLDSDEIRLHLYKQSSVGRSKNLFSLEAVKKQLEDAKLFPLMITNAGMYTKDFEPEGLYVEGNSKTFFVLDTGSKPNANFYLKPNGVFYIDTIAHIDTTGKLASLTKAELQKFKFATQSGPMLVINGNIHKAFIPGSTNLKIRSGVGIISNNHKKIVFAITRDESNFYDFALFFHDVFNCDNALFLDGAISQMYLHDLNPKELGGNFGPMISVTKKITN